MLIGEPGRESVRRSLEHIAAEQLGADHACNLMTVHLALDQNVVAFDLEFDPLYPLRRLSTRLLGGRRVDDGLA